MRMNHETRAALEDSIAHWRRMATGNQVAGESVGPKHCALCRLFISDGCSGCPVSAMTGMSSCRGTPYRDAEICYGDAKRDFPAAARAELKFLISLRPKKRRNAKKT